jgi:hypothetical protein
MNFKSFMYYCALCGGWAALIAWGLQYAAGMQAQEWQLQPVKHAIIVGAIVGILLAGVIGLLDALMNAVGFSRIIRVIICLGIGFLGSIVGSWIGQLLFESMKVKFIGWALVGGVIGASIGVWDVMRASMAGKGMKQAIRKMVNGIIGGTIGGFIGGVLQDLFMTIPWPFGDETLIDKTLKGAFPRFSLATGLVILGMCIGLLIGIAQVVLKEAWVKVEKGFRAGREMILTKPEIIIGRAEGVDIALFGDMQVEKQHARIMLKGDRYVLIDLDTPGGTYINGQKIYGPTPLSNGDVIGCGNSKVRFNEKARR